MVERARLNVEDLGLARSIRRNEALLGDLRSAVRGGAQRVITFREGLEKLRAGNTSRALQFAAGAGGAFSAIGALGGLVNTIGKFVLETTRGRPFRRTVEQFVEGLVPEVLSETLPALLDEANRRERARARSQELASLARADLAARLQDDPDFASRAARIAGRELRAREERRRRLEAAQRPF